MADEIHTKQPRISREGQSSPAESRVFLGAPDYRIFIWGLDVTDDVFSATVTLTLDENVSTAQVNIVNDNEKWICPTAASALPFEIIADELSDRAFSSANGIAGGLSPGTSSAQSRKGVTPMEFAKFKRQNFMKYLSSSPQEAQDLIRRFQSSPSFPYLPGAPVIQAGDRIRIFLKNPWGINGGDNVPSLQPEEWYFGFTGFVAAVTEDFDASYNKSVLRLLCEDIRRLLRYMRVTTNPNIFHMDQVLRTDLGNSQAIAGLVKTKGAVAALDSLRQIATDLVLFNANAAPQAGQPLIDKTDESGKTRQGFVEFMLMGSSDTDLASQGKVAVAGQTTDATLMADGVMGFKSGGQTIITVSADTTVEQTLSPFLDQIYPALTEDQMIVYGQDWSLGSDPNMVTSLGVEFNHLWVLLPNEAHFPKGIYPFDFQPRIDFFSEWRSRLDLINDHVKKLDCTWYATPKGDIIVEFPQYDATPQRYNPPWDSVFTIQNEFKGFSMTEDDRNIKTITISVASPVDQLDLSAGLPPLAYAKIINPELVARYGVREQRENRPFYYKVENSDGLPALAMMLQELANADSFRLEGLECLPNFRAVPGRSYFFKFRNIVGYATMVQHQIVWNNLAQTVYGFNYIRHFDITTGDWRKISGNYGWNWNQFSVPDVVAGDLHNVARGARPASSQAQINPADQTAEVLRTNLQSIPPGTLTDEQDARAKEIIARFDTGQVTNPTERQSLLDEYTSITGTSLSRRTSTKLRQ